MAIDLKKLAGFFAARQTEAAQEAKKLVAASAIELENRAKMMAAVDTGAMRSSIHHEITNGGYTAVIGPSVYYALFQEYGTHKMGAQPFMGPATAAVEPKFIEGLKQIGVGGATNVS